MTKLKEIEYMLSNKGYQHWRWDNGQGLNLKACEFSDNNCYDYGEDEPPLKVDDPDLRFLMDDPRIYFVRCEGCCACGDW